MLSLVKPRYFVPIHGEYRHLVKHAQIASEMGMPDDRILIAEDGDVICFENLQMHLSEPVATGRILVDGKGVGLGLSMTYGIIREHNGVVEVDSKPGKGTVFKIKFPRSSPDEMDYADAKSMSSAI